MPTVQELRARREVKFALPFADVGKVRSILGVNCRRIQYQRPTSLVSSLYFDDDSLRGYRESLEGAGRRRKLRLRWYDEREDGGSVFLEDKAREFEVILKRRVGVELGAAVGSLGFRDLVQALLSEVPGELGEILVSRPRPTLLTRYRREYYQLTGGSARITIDYDLNWFDQSGRSRLSRRFGVSEPRIAIIEGKTRPGEESRLVRMLHPLPLSATRFSKYVAGCQKLGLAEDTRGGFGRFS